MPKEYDILQTATMPAIALRGLTVFPNVLIHFEVSREASVRALEAAMTAGSPVFLVGQKDISVEEPELDDLYQVGTISNIRQILRMPGDNVRVMVEGQARQFVENFRTQIAQQGIPYDQYLQMTGIQESKLLEDAKEPALRQVKMDLAVMAVIKAENIEAGDEDVEEEYKKLAEQFGMDVEMVKKYIQADQVKDQICSRRAVDIVVENATATKPEEKPAEEAAPAEESVSEEEAASGEDKPKKTRKTAAKKTEDGAEKPKRTRRKKTEDEASAAEEAPAAEDEKKDE